MNTLHKAKACLPHGYVLADAGDVITERWLWWDIQPIGKAEWMPVHYTAADTLNAESVGYFAKPNHLPLPDGYELAVIGDVVKDGWIVNHKDYVTKWLDVDESIGETVGENDCTYAKPKATTKPNPEPVICHLDINNRVVVKGDIVALETAARTDPDTLGDVLPYWRIVESVTVPTQLATALGELLGGN
jgi:hypothetical protein